MQDISCVEMKAFLNTANCNAIHINVVFVSIYSVIGEMLEVQEFQGQLKIVQWSLLAMEEKTLTYE